MLKTFLGILLLTTGLSLSSRAQSFTESCLVRDSNGVEITSLSFSSGNEMVLDHQYLIYEVPNRGLRFTAVMRSHELELDMTIWKGEMAIEAIGIPITKNGGTIEFSESEFDPVYDFECKR